MLGGLEMGVKVEATQHPAQSTPSGDALREDTTGRLPRLQDQQPAGERVAGEPWPRVSVVIPTLNEARNLPHVFAKLPSSLHEVIIVDGHSVDDTVAVACQLRPGVRIIRQNRRGKGNALACGFEAATGDIVAMVDADGSRTQPRSRCSSRPCWMAQTSRKARGSPAGGGSCDITRLRRLGNRVLSALVNVLCHTEYSDLCYGYNAFWQRHVPMFGLTVNSDIPAGSGTRLWGDGFEVETLINIRIAQAGLKVTEVPSYEHERIHGSATSTPPATAGASCARSSPNATTTTGAS